VQYLSERSGRRYSLVFVSCLARSPSPSARFAHSPTHFARRLRYLELPHQPPTIITMSAKSARGEGSSEATPDRRDFDAAGSKGRLSRRNPGGVFAPQKSKTTPVIYQSEDGHPENAPLERAPQEGGGGTFTSRTRGGTTLRRQSPRSQFVCICMCVYIM